MASQKEVLKAISTHPDGVGIGQLAGGFDTKPFALTKTLSDLKKKGYITHEGEIYQVTPAGHDSLGKAAAAGKAAALSAGELPGDFDVFRQLGESVGVRGDFLEAVTRHIFRLDYRNITTVFNELNSLALRPDVVVRWVKLWASHLGVPAPPQATAPSPVAAGTVAPNQKPRTFVIIGGDIVPDEAGDYSLNEALRILEAKGSRSDDNETSQLRQEVSSLRDNLQEQRFSNLNLQQEERLNSLKTEVTGQMRHLAEGLDNLGERLSRGASGRSEMDIIHELVEGSLGELRGVRTDVKGYFESQTLPPPKTAEQRQQRVEGLRKGLETNREIDELGRKIFFGEKPPAPTAPIASPAAV